MRFGIKAAALAMVGAVAFLVTLGVPGARPADADVTNISVIAPFGPTNGILIVQVTALDGDGDLVVETNPLFAISNGSLTISAPPLCGPTTPTGAPPAPAFGGHGNSTWCRGVVYENAGTDPLAEKATIPDVNDPDGTPDTGDETNNDLSRVTFSVRPATQGIVGGFGCLQTALNLFGCDTNQTFVPGNLVVKATQDGVTKSITTGLPGQPKTMALSCDPTTLQAGGDEDLGTADIVATVLDGVIAGFPSNDVTVDFESDDTEVATVSPASEPTDVEPVADPGGTAESEATTGDETGTATITATVEGVFPGGFGNAGKTISESCDIDVIGGPHNVALTADPAELVCTAATTVNLQAAVTNEDGDPVVPGNEVRFRARPASQTLVSPDSATTVDTEATETEPEELGIAETDLNFITGTFLGTTAVVVEAAVTRADDFEVLDTATVTCLAAEPAAPPPPAVPPAPAPGAVPGITPPSTGSGGYLPNEDGGLSWQALTGMSLGGLLLTMGGLAARRFTHRERRTT